MSADAASGEPMVAVVTGGHPYDVPGFHRLFAGMAGLDCCIQHMDDFASSPLEVREAYDVVLFYIMMMDGPADDRLQWYQGKPRTALGDLGATEQGIVVLHHAILAYPKWPKWSELVGIRDRSFSYHMDERVRVEPATAEHPITSGLAAWEMTDETYKMAGADDGSSVLLTADHPRSMKTLAWTRHHGGSRVFCFQCGHDNEAWSAAGFREVLARGTKWAARRI